MSYLSTQENASIEILGHTDNTGTETQNLKLSESRASAIANYLTSHGIEESRVSFKGCGSSKPAAANNTEEGRRQNRRVEFVITTE